MVLMLLAKRIVLILTLLGTLISIYYSVVLSRADSLRRDNTLDALRGAVRLVPGNAEYHALLAEHLEAAGLDPDSELALATQLNSPREGRFWIQTRVPERGRTEIQRIRELFAGGEES